MGILEVTMGELRLGWDRQGQEVAHPSFIDLESRGGLGWLEGFNEWDGSLRTGEVRRSSGNGRIPY